MTYGESNGNGGGRNAPEPEGEWVLNIFGVCFKCFVIVGISTFFIHFSCFVLMYCFIWHVLQNCIDFLVLLLKLDYRKYNEYISLLITGKDAP